jgi:predicted transcriptional regulator
MKIDASYVAKYSKGTKPETFLDEKELEFLKSQSIGLINELVADIEKNIFTSYNNYTTSFNVELNSVDDAVKFITMHEGLHLGYAMALKRIVNR